MNAKELVRRWKDRQEQILGMLQESIRLEFQELTVAIRRAENELLESKKAAASEGGRTAIPAFDAGADVAAAFGNVLATMSQRVPLESRKKQVADFLAEHGPATRSQILHGVAIPNGSLANVLLDKELFEQNEVGRWTLADKKGPTAIPLPS
jgi:hypothetical protein